MSSNVTNASGSASGSSIILLVLVSVFIIFIGLLFLQIYLSKRENKWFGIFIPVLSFCVATIFTIFISGTFSQMLLCFILFNIPALIYFIIYAACRETLKKKDIELEKMNIQDLE